MSATTKPDGISVSTTLPIADIKIGNRHRRDMGDIAALAANIADIGLLQPIVVTPDGTLVAGARRIEACRMLSWRDIPATVVDLECVVRGEYAVAQGRRS